nr:hypothetical protein [Burkholderia pyrrocinia]
MDADVLVAAQQNALEPLLEERDWLLAQDIGQCAFNSGVTASRRTERNDAMLRDMMATIAALQDRSSVHASDGDQLHFIRAMERDGQLHGEGVVDLVTFDTLWLFRRADSYIVRYYGMWPAMLRADHGARRRADALTPLPQPRHRMRVRVRRPAPTSRQRTPLAVRSP